MFDIAIDTGGTFTDGLLIDEGGEINIAKSPTTPSDISEGVLNCIALLAQSAGLGSAEELLAKTRSLVFGTTVGSNAVLQLNGARVAMITTEGFRDIIELRRVVKPDMYNLKLPKPTILVPRYRRFGVEERIAYNGKVITPLNEEQARQVIEKIKAHRPEVVAVCFLHSYMNPAHEKHMGELLRKYYPEVKVVLSSSVLPRIMEFERFNTTALAAYIAPVTTAFLDKLEQGLRRLKFPGTLLLMTCNAGVASTRVAFDNPALLLGSGPSAAPLAASFIGRQNNYPNNLSIDMGGTSLDIAVIPGGRILTTTSGMIGDQRNAMETVDVESIGAGGGSIAHLDERGMLCVGPQSAGSSPGPACYARGGSLPAVTDADVILGYVPEDYFLGGALKLNKDLAHQAITEKIARPLGLDTVSAAAAIYTLVNSNMVDRILNACVSKGYDPREFVLCIGGGAGPVHGLELAARLGIKEAFIPKMAAAFSASGMLTADFKHELTRVFYKIEAQTNPEELNLAYRSMERQAVALLEEDGVPRAAMRIRRAADVRYFGQIYELETTLPDTLPGERADGDALKLLVEGFHQRHLETYAYKHPGMPVYVTNLKLKGIGLRTPVRMNPRTAATADPAAAYKRHRPVYFRDPGKFVDTPCYDGDKLQCGNVVSGPAIIEERTTTVVVPPGARIRVDPYGNYIARL